MEEKGEKIEEEDRKKKRTQLVGDFWGRKNTFNLLSTTIIRIILHEM